MNKLRLKMNKDTNLKVQGIFGPSEPFLGTVEVPIVIANLKVPFKMHIFDLPPEKETFLLGNDWHVTYGAKLCFKTQILTIETNGRTF